MTANKQKQVDFGRAELIAKITENEEVNKDMIDIQIKEYTQENYDDNYLDMKIEEEINEEKIRDNLTERLVTELSNIYPYNILRRSYWFLKATKVKSIKELYEYTLEHQLEAFIEEYADNWKEIAKEEEEERKKLVEKEKARISVQIDKALADNAETILDMLGLTPTTAITIFYHRIASTGQMPFEINESDNESKIMTDSGGIKNGSDVSI